jgi:hypothetical protein
MLIFYIKVFILENIFQQTPNSKCESILFLIIWIQQNINFNHVKINF